MAEFQYRKGEFHGVQKTYYPNDSLQSIEYYENNVSQGEFVEFHDNGKVKTEGQYVNGQKDGKWYEYDPEGKLLKETRYKEGGIKSEKEY